MSSSSATDLSDSGLKMLGTTGAAVGIASLTLGLSSRFSPAESASSRTSALAFVMPLPGGVSEK